MLDLSIAPVDGVASILRDWGVTCLMPRHTTSFAAVARVLTHMAEMSRAGVPLAAAVSDLRREAQPPFLAETLFRWQRSLEAGMSISVALQSTAEIVPKDALEFVNLGERTGRLDLGLTRAAELVWERARDAHRRALALGGFLAYSFCVALGLGTLSVWANQSSASTEVLIWVSVLLAASAPYVIALTVLHLLPARARDALMMSTPSARKFGHKAMAGFLEALGSLLEAGIGVVPALEWATAATPNASVRVQIRRCVQQHEADGDTEGLLRGLPWLTPNEKGLLVTHFHAGSLPTGALDVAKMINDTASTNGGSLFEGLFGDPCVGWPLAAVWWLSAVAVRRLRGAFSRDSGR